MNLSTDWLQQKYHTIVGSVTGRRVSHRFIVKDISPVKLECGFLGLQSRNFGHNHDCCSPLSMHGYRKLPRDDRRETAREFRIAQADE